MTEDIKNVWFRDAYMEGDLLFGVDSVQNIFFQYDMKRKKLKRMEIIHESDNTSEFGICAIFRYKQILYCFSLYSYKVVSYDLEKKIFTYYRPEKEMEGIKISSVCRVGNDVWMLKKGIESSVVVFSMEKGLYSNYDLEIQCRQTLDTFRPIPWESSVNIGVQIWKCIPGSNSIMVLDTRELKGNIIKFDLQIPFFTMSYKDGYFYILGMDGKQIVVWNQDTQETMVWETGYDGNKDRPFREVIRIENRLFLLPGSEQKIRCYEINENRIHFLCRIDYPLGFEKIHESNGMFLGKTFRNNNELYLFPFGGNGIICLNTDSLTMDFYPVQISEMDYIASQTQAKELLYEEQVSMEDLLDFLKSETVDNAVCNVKTSNIGHKCWEKLRGEN